MMATRCHLYKLLILLMLVYIVPGTADTVSPYFEILLGYKMQDDLNYWEGESVSALHCATKCARNESCTSASYNDIDGSCRLSVHRGLGPNTQDKLAVDSAWTVLARKGCQQDWVDLDQTCYLFENDEKNYTDAQIYCEQNAGRLAEPQTNATFQLLRNFMINTFTENIVWWFGLMRNESGAYYWASTGASPVYNGGIRYPSSTGLCGILYQIFDFKWGNTRCNKTEKFVCEN